MIGCWLLLLAGPLLADHETINIEVDVETEVELRRFPADGEVVLLGLPCDQGGGEAEMRAAETLAAAGIEVWMADLLSAHFLPIAPSSMRSLDGNQVRTLVDHAHKTTGKQVVLMASGFGAVPLLRGAEGWQSSDQRLIGGILLHPMLSEAIPEPGEEMVYLPIVERTSLPLVILQPARSPQRFWLQRLAKQLEKGGSRVTTEVIPGVRNHYYKRNDATEQELVAAAAMDRMIARAIATLQETK